MANLIMWSPNVADFSKDYRVYAIDTMGQPGRSIPDPDEPIRDTADFVAWLSATLDGLNLDRVFLVGMSYGGWLALNFAVTTPDRVRKLVLLSPAASFQPVVRQMGLRGMLMFLIPTRLTVETCFAWLGFKDTPGDALARSMIDLACLGVRHFRFLPETARIMPSVFSDDELRGLNVPVLLLIGDREVIYDPEEALARARRLIPDFEGDLVPQSSHEMCASQHQVVDARVLEFLSDN
jgi:pimeloyl-ACP methyl ester carboxylesterase